MRRMAAAGRVPAVNCGDVSRIMGQRDDFRIGQGRLLQLENAFLFHYLAEHPVF